jgi:hypothetical protein
MPTRLSIYQGHLPSCQTLSAIGAIALNASGKQLLERIMTEKRPAVWVVRFPHYESQLIEVDLEKQSVEWDNLLRHMYDERLKPVMKVLPAGFRISPPFRPGHVRGDDFVRVLEIAYAKLMAAKYPDIYGHINDGDILQVYCQPGFHYRASQSLADFSGWPVEELIASGGSVPEESQSFEVENANGNPKAIERLKGMLHRFAREKDRYAAIACTVGKPGEVVFPEQSHKILPWHDHIIKRVDEHEESIELLDPYNSRIGLVLPFEDFFRFFNLIALAEVPG